MEINKHTAQELEVTLHKIESATQENSTPTLPITLNGKRKKKEDMLVVRSYPTPRDMAEQYLLSEEESRNLMPVYKSEILKLLINEQERAVTPDKKSEMERNIVVVQNGKADNLLSTLSYNSSGCTMDKVLRLLPEILYRQNKELNTLEDGRAHRALQKKEDGQLNLFLEMEERMMSANMNDERPIIKYNAREWARLLYGGSKPQTTQIRAIEKVVDTLANFRIYFPLGNGIYVWQTLIRRDGIGVLDANDRNGKGNYEYISLSSIFTLSLTEGKKGITADKGVVWCVPMETASKVLGNTSIEWRLLSLLEKEYSYAKGDIRTASAKKECVLHRENKDAIISKVSKEANTTSRGATGGSHKNRVMTDIANAFTKMEQIGLIEPNSFKEVGNNYEWLWCPDFLKRKEDGIEGA